jgi:glycosyltransferase involved in cell wall biosynthesis
MEDPEMPSSRPGRTATNGADGKVAYVIGTFPVLTTTFITREVLELKRRGVPLVLVSLRRPTPFPMSPETERLADKTIYVLPVDWRRLVAAHVQFAVTQARVYWKTLLYLVSRPHSSLRARLKTVLHFGEGVQVAELLQSRGVRHIHAHFADRAATVALVASRLLGIRYSLTAHANDIYVAPVLLREKIAEAKFVVTCTAHNQAYLEALASGPIRLLYHGLDFAALPVTAELGPAAPEPLVLSVGQLKEKKGFRYLIQACQQLRDQGLVFRCEIIGEGPEREKLTALIQELKLTGSVALCGAIRHTEVMRRYAAAALFVLPCVAAADGDRDGIPNVLLEAMACQVPVVSTRHSGIPEVVQDGVTGLLAEPANAKSLADSMARLLQDRLLRERLGQAGRRCVEQRFDVRQNTEELANWLTA